MDYYSAIKRNTTWMDLNGIILSKKGQSPKVTYSMIPSREHFLNDKMIEMQNKSVVARL